MRAQPGHSCMAFTDLPSTVCVHAAECAQQGLFSEDSLTEAACYSQSSFRLPHNKHKAWRAQQDFVHITVNTHVRPCSKEVTSLRAQHWRPTASSALQGAPQQLCASSAQSRNFQLQLCHVTLFYSCFQQQLINQKLPASLFSLSVVPTRKVTW